jgi:hypothetical protein
MIKWEKKSLLNHDKDIFNKKESPLRGIWAYDLENPNSNLYVFFDELIEGGVFGFETSLNVKLSEAAAFVESNLGEKSKKLFIRESNCLGLFPKQEVIKEIVLQKKDIESNENLLLAIKEISNGARIFAKENFFAVGNILVSKKIQNIFFGEYQVLYGQSSWSTKMTILYKNERYDIDSPEFLKLLQNRLEFIIENRNRLRI